MAQRRTKSKADSVHLDDSLRLLILHGPDLYLRTEKLRVLREAIEAARGEVDVIHFNGASDELATILDEARSLGLMQQYKIVVVDNAEALVQGDTNRRILERYAENPTPDATLVLRAVTWRPGNLDKLAAKVGAVIKCETPSEEAAEKFCIRKCQVRYECEIEPAAARLLVQRMGCDLARLDSELARLSLYAPATKKGTPVITREIVAREVAASKEEKAWEIQSSLLSGDPAAALTAMRDMFEVSRHSHVLLSYALTDLCWKMHAAHRLLKSGSSEKHIASELRIWGSGGREIFNAARRLSPQTSARLLDRCLDVDLRNRSSLGEPQRSLERVTAEIVTAIAAADR